MTKTLRICGLFFVTVFALLALVACAPSNSDKAKEKMEKAGYSCLWSARSEVGDNGEVGTLTCSYGKTLGGIIDGLGNGLTATLYDSTANAKKAFNESKDAEGKSNYQQIGKWVVYGSEEAIKAFK